jgi:hypothetical protein
VTGEKRRCAICGEEFEVQQTRWDKVQSVYFVGVLFLNALIGLTVIFVSLKHLYDPSALFMLIVGSIFVGTGLYPFIAVLLNTGDES